MKRWAATHFRIRAAILWMLFAAPFALRKWRRTNRGLCPKYAYDLRGSTGGACPECGTCVSVSDRPRRREAASLGENRGSPQT